MGTFRDVPFSFEFLPNRNQSEIYLKSYFFLVQTTLTFTHLQLLYTLEGLMRWIFI